MAGAKDEEVLPGGMGVAATVGAGALLLGGALAWATRSRGDEVREAPGRPGDEPRWYYADKCGVGTAVNPTSYSTSLVWFTLSRGILSEVFYPRVDRACTRDLGLIVTDGSDFFSDEAEDARHEVAYLEDGVPVYHLKNTCKQGRYTIEKTVLAHPTQNVVLQLTRFTPKQGKLADYHLYAVLEPHLSNRGAGNTAWVGDHRGVPMLFAQRQAHALALGCSVPWREGSAGFVGESDGREDLRRHKRMEWRYDRAEDGDVALTGEIDLAACGGTFVLALGFGPSPGEAGHRALAALHDDFNELLGEYARAWRDWQGTLRAPEPVGEGGRDLYRTSAMVLRTHEDQSIPGGMIASLATPWGEARGDETEDGTGGYHLVWPRDLVESAQALVAIGAGRDALLVLRYLQATQMADGHWPQNMWVSSEAYWTGLQLGETAFPILLLDSIRRAGLVRDRELARYWPMVRRAVGYIVRSGPSTQQDRWENEQGYTPYTLANVIAALLAGAEIAESQGEGSIAAYLRETADAWNAAIESWLYAEGTELARRVGVDGYYVRTVPAELDEGSTPRMGRLKLKGHPKSKRGIPIDEVVSPDALALVRFGLRAPDDPRIVNTVKAIDAVLKVETPRGPSWHRYNGDGYGEHADGSPMGDMNKRGFGRAWPLLTGERAHYELMAGRKDEAIRLLRAMEAFAGDGGMIPEQIWDTEDIPEKGLFKGRPSGSAMPLVWAHAEYLKLRRSIQEGRVFDLPPQTVRRYLVEKIGSDRALWHFRHRRRAISEGETLRVELTAAATVRWKAGGGAHETPTRDTGLGLHYADLPTEDLRAGGRIEMTFHWTEADRDEGKTFVVDVVSEG